MTALLEELTQVPVGSHPPTEVAAQATTPWLSTPVAQALPGAVTAPPAALPVVPTPPPARQHTGFPYWLAITALALATVLPPVVGSSIALTSMSRGSWVVVAPIAFGIATCTAALFLTRRPPTVPVPRWPRYLHALATVLNTGPVVYYMDTTASRRPLSFGAYAYMLGTAMLVYGLVRFPSSNRARTPS